MKDKHYGLNNKPNEGVKDEAPQWMNSLFKELSENKPKSKKSHPFEGIDDPILNPNKIGISKKPSE
jgi:hypothetical protein